VVEEEETLHDTLCRELREELNYDTGAQLDGFEYLCSHEAPPPPPPRNRDPFPPPTAASTHARVEEQVPAERMRTHFFAKEVTSEEFFETERNAHKVAAPPLERRVTISHGETSRSLSSRCPLMSNLPKSERRD
jgi:8-oxo-dGTP pyrophosphatase MutT (NUDIX family)